MPEYTVGCLTVVESTGPTTTHLGLTNVDFPTNVEVSDDDSGTLYPQFQSITGFAPVASLTTKNVTRMISMIGLNGTCVGAGKLITQVDVVSRKLETCQTALGATPHMRDRVTTGLLRLATLSASRGQDATMSAILDTFTDGTNGPVARTDGVALPTPVFSERLTLGQLAIAGVVYPDVESVSLEFNVSISEKTPALGFVWPDSAGVLTVRPVLTLQGRDLSKVTAALLAFSANAAAHANTKIQLIRRLSGGAFAPFASAVHTAITMAGLVVPDNLVSASANQRGTHTLRLLGHDDGTNAPVLFNTAIAYDTTP
jgi:hypothetical protein